MHPIDVPLSQQLSFIQQLFHQKFIYLLQVNRRRITFLVTILSKAKSLISNFKSIHETCLLPWDFAFAILNWQLKYLPQFGESSRESSWMLPPPWLPAEVLTVKTWRDPVEEDTPLELCKESDVVTNTFIFCSFSQSWIIVVECWDICA